MIAGGAAVVAGVLLPWLSSPLRSASGLDMDGIDGMIALIVGVLLIVLGFVAAAQGMVLATRIMAGIGAVVALYIGAWNWSQANDLADLGGGVISIGPGLPVIAIGAVVALVGLLIPEDEEEVYEDDEVDEVYEDDSS